MTDMSGVRTELNTGHFRLITGLEEVARAYYDDDAEIRVYYKTDDEEQDCLAVFRFLAATPFDGYRGRTTTPEGVLVYCYKKPDGSEWIEISLR